MFNLQLCKKSRIDQLQEKALILTLTANVVIVVIIIIIIIIIILVVTTINGTVAPLPSEFRGRQATASSTKARCMLALLLGTTVHCSWPTRPEHGSFRRTHIQS